MRYHLQPATPRPLDKVVAGAATDARWRNVDARSERLPHIGRAICADRVRVHELHRENETWGER